MDIGSASAAVMLGLALTGYAYRKDLLKGMGLLTGEYEGRHRLLFVVDNGIIATGPTYHRDKSGKVVYS